MERVGHAVRLLFPNIPGWTLYTKGTTYYLKHFQFPHIFFADNIEYLKKLVARIEKGTIFYQVGHSGGYGGISWTAKPPGSHVASDTFHPLTEEEMEYACKPDPYVFEGEDPVSVGPLFGRSMPRSIADTDEEGNRPWQSYFRRLYEENR